MIHPRELRIGNYVSILDRGKIEPYYITTKVTQILHNEVKTEHHKYTDSCLCIKPIPLTEDILVKCGFDANYESGFVAYKMDAKDVYGHVFDISLVEDNTNSTFNYVCWDINYGIKYVHESQNLYFAITGKELELKL